MRNTARPNKAPLRVEALEDRCQPSGVNLLGNPDFELGATGFGTDYAVGATVLDTGQLAVASDPKLANVNLHSFGDHTSGSGLMLIANGSTLADQIVWRQTVAVSSLTDYEFSGFVATAYPSSPAVLEIRVNGELIGTATAPSAAGSFFQFTFAWNSAAATTAEITIEDTNIAMSGNDFALDDLSFTAVTITDPPPRPVFAVAADAGGTGEVKVFDAETLALVKTLTPFGTGPGVRVAVGDVTGDGIADIVAVAGKGIGPQVKVFDGGADYAEVASFLAFAPSFQGGGFVAVGNFDGDAALEVVIGKGKGGPSRVRIFNIDGGIAALLTGPLGDFRPMGKYAGGVTVAAGNYSNATDHDELVVGTGPGGLARVKVFGADGASPRLLAKIKPFGKHFTGGVFVAVGDVDGDSSADIMVSRGKGIAAAIKLYGDTDANLLTTFKPYPANIHAGVRIALIDRDADGRADTLLTGLGRGASPEIRLWDTQTLDPVDSFFAFDQTATAGVFVG